MLKLVQEVINLVKSTKKKLYIFLEKLLTPFFEWSNRITFKPILLHTYTDQDLIDVFGSCKV